MGRTKDRASQMSQGPSNTALLEVIAQLRLQNQELLNLQASQQSVKGTVKAQARMQASQQRVKGTVKTQARHTPATFSDISTIHPAADSAWKHMKAESVPARATSDKVIIQDGRSDPAAHSFEEFRFADASICLATQSEADEAMREMSL